MSTPATVAALVAARTLKPAPAAAPVSVREDVAPVAARTVPTLTLRPKSLSDWVRWTHDLGCAGARMDSTGEALVADITVGGVQTRLVGEGVPALYRAHNAAHRAVKGGVSRA